MIRSKKKSDKVFPLLNNRMSSPKVLYSKIKPLVNYKNIFLLRNYISLEGKILPKRLTKLKANQQRRISKEIKKARILSFLPFIRQVD